MSEKAQNKTFEINNTFPNQTQNLFDNSENNYYNRNSEPNILNKNIQKRKIIYQKPTKKQNDLNNLNINNKSNDYISNISNKDNDDKNNIYLEEHSEINNINQKTYKDNKIKEISDNLKENEIKLEKVNKTMIDLLNNKKEKEDINSIKYSNNTKSFISQINDIEKLQQENLTLKADSIIYREDLIRLTEINKKLKEELEIENKKIYDLIAKGEESLQILNNKNYEINRLTEAISNLKLSNSTEIINNIKDNRTKEQIIFEMQFELKNLNNDKIRIETEKKMLEEQYNNILKEKNLVEKEDEICQNKVNNNINYLENNLKNLEKTLNELMAKNNELKIDNQKINENIGKVKKEKNYFENEYQKKTEQFNELDDEFKKLENKYAQLLYDIQKQKFIEEKIQKEEEKQNQYKRKKNKSAKKLIINDLFDKIQTLKQKVKNERETDNKK